LERISQLDDRVAQLKNENTDLAAVVKKMKASVALLKQEVIEHVNSGCEIRMTDTGSFS
jgi:transcription factor AP-1